MFLIAVGGFERVQARFLLAKLNPSATHDNVTGFSEEVIFTDDVALSVKPTLIPPQPFRAIRLASCGHMYTPQLSTFRLSSMSQSSTSSFFTAFLLEHGVLFLTSGEHQLLLCTDVSRPISTSFYTDCDVPTFRSCPQLSIIRGRGS